MNYPTDLKYSKTHEWVKEEDGMTVVGISDFAQDSLGAPSCHRSSVRRRHCHHGRGTRRRGICQGSFLTSSAR